MDSSPSLTTPLRVLDRYAVFDSIASGGMATVHLGRQVGHGGFVRTVAIKRLHPNLAQEREFVAMLVDEARLVSRIHHPNVVQTLDVVVTGNEVFLVLEYINGEPLSRLLAKAHKAGRPIPLPLLSAVIGGMLYGLHAGHEARDDSGNALNMVHRDVSPQNVMVGIDGVARLLDFGVAKAAGRLQTTREGQIKGKLAYLAPEMIHHVDVSRRADIFAAGVVLWECLANRRLFSAASEAGIVAQILVGLVEPPSNHAPDLPEALDALALKALELDPEKRFETAAEMAAELHRIVPPALNADVAAWVREVAAVELESRAALVAKMESKGEISSSSVIAHDDSSMTVATDGGDRTPRKARNISYALFAALLLAMAISLLTVRALTSDKSSAKAEPVGSPSASASASASLPGAGERASATAASPSSTTSASSDVATTAGVAPPRTSTADGRVRRDRPRTTPATDCSVPYTIDASGMKIYKRNCLK